LNPRASAPRALIFTADDFGLHPAVNRAVDEAARGGVLTAASLMVGGPAAADAVRRARLLPALRVGLHLVLAEGTPTLPPHQVTALVNEAGRFGSNMVRDGIRFFFRSDVRRQLEAEIRAQFEAFAATGLPLDHVNTHKHFHLHPTVLSLILQVGRDYGMRAVRLPRETRGSVLLEPWMRLLARRLDQAGIAHNDQVVGLRATGQMDEAAVLAALDDLTGGVTEFYFHPATLSGGIIAPAMKGYRHADELAALVSARVRAKVHALAVPTGGYADLCRPQRR
jgi:hopanoid biosynthesis associated protein HpnK